MQDNCSGSQISIMTNFILAVAACISLGVNVFQYLNNRNLNNENLKLEQKKLSPIVKPALMSELTLHGHESPYMPIKDRYKNKNILPNIVVYECDKFCEQKGNLLGHKIVVLPIHNYGERPALEVKLKVEKRLFLSEGESQGLLYKKAPEEIKIDLYTIERNNFVSVPLFHKDNSLNLYGPVLKPKSIEYYDDIIEEWKEEDIPEDIFNEIILTKEEIAKEWERLSKGKLSGQKSEFPIGFYLPDYYKADYYKGDEKISMKCSVCHLPPGKDEKIWEELGKEY